VKHLRQPVRFSDGLQELLKVSAQVYLEVGPGRGLCQLVREHLDRNSPAPVLTSTRHPQEIVSDQEHLMGTLGRLWLAGAAINWAAFSAHEQRRRFCFRLIPSNANVTGSNRPNQPTALRLTVVLCKE
jgi:acyl transferase domain-containing protein